MSARHRAASPSRLRLVLAFALAATLIVTLLQATGFGPFASQPSQALGAPTIITLESSSETFLAGDEFTLTATTDVPVEDSSSVVEIVDSSTYTTIKTCNVGMVCEVEATFASGDAHVYVAHVGSLSSDPISVERAEWEVELTSAKSATLAGQTSLLTATANQNVTNTSGEFVIDIFDVTSGQRLKSCAAGQVCTVNSPVFYIDDEHMHSFVAVVAAPGDASSPSESTDIQATSESVSLSRESWSLEMTTTASMLSVGEAVTVTVTANQNIGLTNGKYAIYIIDIQNQQPVKTCWVGTVCMATRPYTTIGSEHSLQSTFMAFVAASGLVDPGSPSLFTDIQTASNVQPVSTGPWAAETSISRTSAKAGDVVTITATVSEDVGESDGYLSIYVFEYMTGRLIEECSTGITCVATDRFYTAGDNGWTNYLYQSAVGPSGMNPSTIFDLPIAYWSGVSELQQMDRILWNISLKRVNSTQFQVTSDQNVGLTQGNFAIYFFAITPDAEDPDPRVGDTCYSGKVCLFAEPTVTGPAVAGAAYFAVVAATPEPADSSELLKEVTSSSYYPATPTKPPGPTLRGETVGGANPAEQPCQCQHSDPVNAATGEFFLPVTDLVLSGIGPALTASRTYSTANSATDGLFGYGWVSSFNARVETVVEGTLADPRPRQVVVIQENGSAALFTLDDGVYAAPERVLATLELNSTSGIWTFTRKKSEILTFDTDGLLTSLSDRFGNAVTVARDTGGLLTTAVASGGRSLTFTWTDDHVTAISDSAGRTVSFSYDLSGNLATATGADGSVSTYIYDSDHLMTNLEIPGGAVTANTYDDDGRVIEQSDPLDRVTSFTYDGTGTLITSPDGSQQYEEYSDGVLVSQTLAVGTDAEATTRYSYDEMLNVTAVVDPRGGVSAATYDSDGHALSRSDALGRTSTWTYDAFGSPTSATDPLNRTSTATYDLTGRLTSTTSAAGSVNQWSYNSNGTVATWTDPLGQVSLYSYNTAGLMTASTDPDGRTTLYTFDLAGNSTGVTAADGAAAVTVTDVLGRVLSITDPLGSEVSYGYDAAGNRDTVVSPDLSETSSTFDAAGQVTSVTDAAGQVTLYSYTPNGQLASVTDANNHSQTNTYDERGNLVSSTDALSRTTLYEYDLSSNMTKATAPSGAIALATYDAGNQVTSTTDPMGHTTLYSYDLAGQLVSVTDPLGRTTHTEYNLDGQPSKVTSADEGTVAYFYDASGRLEEFVNADGKSTTYAYTDSGLPLSKTEPGGATSSHTYDSAGRVASTVRPDASSMTYDYDLAGKVVGIDFSDPAEVDTAFSYDTAGRLVQVVDSTGTTSLDYDVAGRLVSEEDGDGQVVGYQYDHVGQITTLVYPSGHEVDYVYDAVGQTASVTDWANRAVTFTYNLDGQLTSQTMPNGTVQTTDYDISGQTTLISLAAGSTPVASFDYSYDDAGQIAGTTVTNGGTTKTVGFEYDDISQLSSVATTAGGVTDTAGLSSTSAGLLTQTQRGEILSYNSAQQLTTLTPIFDPAVSYAYDANGSRTSATTASTPALTTSYTYTASGKLASVVTPATTVNYTVDARGLRQSRTSGLATEEFAWSTSGSLALLLSDGGHEYVYGVTPTPVAQVAIGTGAVEYLGTDVLGSVRTITDNSGAVVATADYDAYGKLSATTGTSHSDFGFTGNWTDEDTGLIYLRARDYDPSTGQFLTVDPAVDQTRQPYAYAGNNPISRTDHSGLDWGEVVNFFEDVRDNALAAAAGAADYLTGGMSSEFLRSTVPGYDCFIQDHQDAFDSGQVVAVVADVVLSVVAIVASAGTATGAVVALTAARAAVRAGLKAVVSTVKRVVVSAVERTAVRSGARPAAAEVSSGVRAATPTPAMSCMNSFTASTPVAMADGSQKPISEVVVGDEVVATDPDTGQSGSRPVAELIRHGGQHTMVELAFEDGSVLTATDGHPFWDVSTGLFTDAIDLQAGELVLALDGSTLEIDSVRVYGEDLTAYNLEIAGIHTYYAGATPVLVHNSCGAYADDADGLAHAAERHLPGGSQVDSRSGLFDVGTDLGQLAQGTRGQIGTWQVSNDGVRSISYTLQHSGIVGTTGSGMLTTSYQVLRNPLNGALRTMFPVVK